jgi:Arc/MetJ family transcription regulator
MARTTLILDDELLREAMEVSGATTKTATVHAGLQELVAKASRRRLAQLRGTHPQAEAAPRRRPAPAADPAR